MKLENIRQTTRQILSWKICYLLYKNFRNKTLPKFSGLPSGWAFVNPHLNYLLMKTVNRPKTIAVATVAWYGTKYSRMEESLKQIPSYTNIVLEYFAPYVPRF